MNEIGRPEADEYAPYYGGYVSLVDEADLMSALERQVGEVRNWASRLPRDKERHRYAEGKWSVREVLGHLGDGERVFGYRALCIGRGDATALPSFDEQAYVAAAGYDEVRVSLLVGNWAAFREANLATLRSFEPEDWRRIGTTRDQPMSARALGAILVGHVRHHMNVLKERYGV
jgi:hypothetical protein